MHKVFRTSSLVPADLLNSWDTSVISLGLLFDGRVCLTIKSKQAHNTFVVVVVVVIVFD